MAPAGFAQAPDAADTGGALEEITVTAQRRAENVQDVPIAISAFSANELEKRNVATPLDIIQYVPNLNGNNNTGLGSANVYFLRGLGNTESIATFDPPVGTYVDDIYIARQNSNNFGLFDVERIEVLRGPQGTLFGRNTTGGAINLLLRKPGDTMRGFAEVGLRLLRRGERARQHRPAGQRPALDPGRRLLEGVGRLRPELHHRQGRQRPRREGRARSRPA